VKIIYFAKHDQTSSNDDEGAIAHAFEQLGHEVVRVSERKPGLLRRESGDFLLLHHCKDAYHTVAALPYPKVFWCFDRIEDDDPTLRIRTLRRRMWMNAITETVDAGFCTDGDWVAKDTTGKLTWLMQGADERIVGKGNTFPVSLPPIVFTGTTRGCGSKRVEFAERMKAIYRDSFIHVQGIYRENLANAISSTQILVAPIYPVSDRYWSNRVYLTTGFGGLLLHPHARGLRDHFTADEVPTYDTMEDLFQLIAHYRDSSQAREQVANAGLKRVMKEHLYRHRVQTMLDVLKSKGLI